MNNNRMRRWYVTAFVVLVACKQNASKLDGIGSGGPRVKLVADAGDAGFAGDLEKIRAKLKLPGVAAAAWRDGELLEMAAVGVRKEGDPTKVTEKDQWHLGSNTKAMTATLIAIYVDRGKLRWEDTIAQLFPGWKIDPGYAKVTLDQLLRHQGGAPGDPPADLWKQLWTDGDAPDAREKFVKAILEKAPAQAPGTFVYSNTSYMIAGAALEHVTGVGWEKLMRDELFAKLGMTSCGFGAPGVKIVEGATSVVDQPRGHDAGGTPLEPGPSADNPRGLGPAGTVHCSLGDYGKFLNLHATGKPEGIVTPESMQHLHTPRDGEYAGGWGVVESPKGPVLLHSGSNTLWYATALVAPGTRFAFAIATNKFEQGIENELGALLVRFEKK
jgi:CubicO group peptidase (beta-lactamase class C family)